MWHKNIKSFHKVCRGHYGRKVIFSNVREVNRENVRNVMGNALSIHNQNRREIDYLYQEISRFYIGKRMSGQRSRMMWLKIMLWKWCDL